MFYIELSSESVGVGVNYGDPHFIFFLKGKIIVYEIKTNLKIFNVRFFNIQFTLKIVFLFWGKISFLSQLGKTNKFSHFLISLMS